MKNFLLLCFLLLAGSSKLQAQPYPSIFGIDSTVWHVLGDDFHGASPYEPPTLTHTIKGDTLFDGKSYKKVTTTVSRPTYNVPTFFIREDLNSGKVWTRLLVGQDTSERVLINFSLRVGDTFFRKPTLPSLIVKRVYFDSLNRKHIVLDDNHLIGYGTQVNNIEFVTGIGNNWGLRYNYNFSSYSVGDVMLICAFKDQEQIYKDTAAMFVGTCTYPLTLALTDPKKEKSAFQITPNPVTEHLSVSLPAGTASAVIYNVAGQKMTTLSGSTKTLKIDCSQWQPGVYILRLQDKFGSVSSQTFLKQ